MLHWDTCLLSRFKVTYLAKQDDLHTVQAVRASFKDMHKIPWAITVFILPIKSRVTCAEALPIFTAADMLVNQTI